MFSSLLRFFIKLIPHASLVAVLDSWSTTLQNGVMFFSPLRKSSKAASETILKKIPVVTGQVVSALYVSARSFLSVLMLTFMPFGI